MADPIVGERFLCWALRRLINVEIRNFSISAEGGSTAPPGTVAAEGLDSTNHRSVNVAHQGKRFPILLASRKLTDPARRMPELL